MRTHWYPVGVAECILNLIELDQSFVFQIVCKAQSFDIFLKARGYLTLVPPEAIPFKFDLQSSIHNLNIT